MRTLRKFGFAIIAVIALLAASSCSSDEESTGGSGSSSTTLDGSKFSASYAYWYIIEQGQSNILVMEFYSCNRNKPSFPLNMVSFSYDIPKDQTEIENVTLSNDEYDIYLVKDMTMNDEGWQGENWKNRNANSSLVIKRNGNKISVSLENANIYDDSNTPKVFSFNYEGSITRIEDEWS